MKSKKISFVRCISILIISITLFTMFSSTAFATTSSPNTLYQETVRLYATGYGGFVNPVTFSGTKLYVSAKIATGSIASGTIVNVFLSGNGQDVKIFQLHTDGTIMNGQIGIDSRYQYKITLYRYGSGYISDYCTISIGCSSS